MKKFRKVSGHIIKSVGCPSCKSQGRDSTDDHLKIYEKDDGTVDSFCHACQTKYSATATEQILEGEGEVVVSQAKPKRKGRKPTLAEMLTLPSLRIEDRRIDKKTVEFYGVRMGLREGKEVYRFYPRTKKGKITGYKCRKLPKFFEPKNGAIPIGDNKEIKEFFGQRLFNPGRILIITAGEEDAMAVFQATQEHGRKGVGYASVSAQDGCGSLKKAVKDNLEWVSQFEKVVFAVDQEEGDLKYASECCKILPPGKGYIAKFSENDASDMLAKGKSKELYHAVWEAQKWSPEGVILSSRTWEAWENRNNYEGVLLPHFMGLNSILRGISLGDLVTIGAGTGVGKTTFMKHLQYHFWKKTDYGIGVIALEEPLCDSVGLLMGLHLKQRLQEHTGETTDQHKKAWEDLFKDDRFSFEQGFGGMSDEDLFSKIRYMVHSQNCKFIFLDHLTAIVDTLGDGKGSKVDQTARLVAKIKDLTQELDCAIILVSHVRKTSEGSKSYEEGGVPNLDALYGAACVKQYSNTVITLSRNQKKEPSVVTPHVLKNRRGGRLGKGNRMTYNMKTGWLEKYDGEVLEDEEE